MKNSSITHLINGWASYISNINGQHFLQKQSQIEKWLKSYHIQDYYLIKDEKWGFTVNVRHDVNLSGHKLSFIPVKFGHVNGEFNCSNNRLKNLDFAPVVVKGNFVCSNNLLESLQGSPQEVENFYCASNKIKSLIGCPREANDFNCKNNELTHLWHGPEIVRRNFDCSQNKLMSLISLPPNIKSLDCSDNQLTSLEGIGPVIDGSLFAQHNEITNLKDCPKVINGVFDFTHNPVDTLLYFPEHVTNYVKAPGNKSWGGVRDFKDIYELHLIEREKANLTKALGEVEQLRKIDDDINLIKIKKPNKI